MTIRGSSPPHPHGMSAANRTLSCDKNSTNTRGLPQAPLSVRIYLHSSHSQIQITLFVPFVFGCLVLCLGVACRVHLEVLPRFDSEHSSCISLRWLFLQRDRGPRSLRSILGLVFGVCVARRVQVCFAWENHFKKMFGVRRCWLDSGFTVIRQFTGLLTNSAHFLRAGGLWETASECALYFSAMLGYNICVSSRSS